MNEILNWKWKFFIWIKEWDWKIVKKLFEFTFMKILNDKLKNMSHCYQYVYCLIHYPTTNSFPPPIFTYIYCVIIQWSLSKPNIYGTKFYDKSSVYTGYTGYTSFMTSLLFIQVIQVIQVLWQVFCLYRLYRLYKFYNRQVFCLYRLYRLYKFYDKSSVYTSYTGYTSFMTSLLFIQVIQVIQVL